MMENVPGLRGDRRFALLRARLRRMGYGIWSEIVDAASFGVPQRRRRLVLIALRDKDDDAVPRPDRGHAALRRSRRNSTVREVLKLVRNHCKGDPLARGRTVYPVIVAQRIAAIPTNGGGRSSLGPELELACHAKLKRGGAGSAYGRMKYDAVAPTLTTRCVTPACGRFLHPRARRPITLREAACLQTFPVRYVFNLNPA
jgi:DNA (cytosine-5)-methyltransferase 1